MAGKGRYLNFLSLQISACPRPGSWDGTGQNRTGGAALRDALPGPLCLFLCSFSALHRSRPLLAQEAAGQDGQELRRAGALKQRTAGQSLQHGTILLPHHGDHGPDVPLYRHAVHQLSPQLGPDRRGASHLPAGRAQKDERSAEGRAPPGRITKNALLCSAGGHF